MAVAGGQITAGGLLDDVYPYTASSLDLSAFVSAWAHDGGTARLLERLRDPACRARLVAEGPAFERSFERIYVSLVRTAPFRASWATTPAVWGCLARSRPSTG